MHVDLHKAGQRIQHNRVGVAVKGDESHIVWNDQSLFRRHLIKAEGQQIAAADYGIGALLHAEQCESGAIASLQVRGSMQDPLLPHRNAGVLHGDAESPQSQVSDLIGCTLRQEADISIPSFQQMLRRDLPAQSLIRIHPAQPRVVARVSD